MKRCIAGIAVLLAVGVFATDMEQKARTILTCRTSNAGVAEITCDDPGDWRFAAEASVNNGRDVVTIVAYPGVMPTNILFRLERGLNSFSQKKIRRGNDDD